MTKLDEIKRTWTIEKWVESFGELYKDTDQHKSEMHIWMNVVDDASALAESIRKGELVEASMQLPHIFCWYCCFIAKCYNTEVESTPAQPIGNLLGKDDTKHRNITRWIIEKYPELCPVCGCARCMCPSFKDEAEDRKANGTFWHWQVIGKLSIADKMDNFRKNKPTPTVEELVFMFKKIYSGTHYELPIGTICFHLLEEIGEVSQVILKLENLASVIAQDHRIGEKKVADIYKDKKNIVPSFNKISCLKDLTIKDLTSELKRELKKELADVFSWLATMVNKLNQCLKNNNYTSDILDHFSLTDLLYSKYFTEEDNYLRCPHCKQTKCSNACIVQTICQKSVRDIARRECFTILVVEAKGDGSRIRVPNWGQKIIVKKDGKLKKMNPKKL